MSALDRLGKNINALNILLLTGVAVLAAYLVSPPALGNKKIGSSLPAPQRPQVTAEVEIAKTDKNGSPSPADFAVVAENNLFHGERKVPPDKMAEAALPRPEIVLFGTMITDEMSVAFIEDKKSPKTTPGRGKRQTALKKGDAISGFQLTSIESDRIVLVRGEESITVHLLDLEKRKDGAQTSIPVSRNLSGGVSAPVAQSLPLPIQRQPLSTVGANNQSPNVSSTRGGR